MSNNEIEQLGEALTQLGEKTAKAIEKLGDNILHWRAWESMLFLLTVRYYLRNESPINHALADREFLANCWKKHGNNEEVAHNFNEIYKTIIGMLEDQSRWATSLASSEQSDSDDLPM